MLLFVYNIAQEVTEELISYVNIHVQFSINT